MQHIKSHQTLAINRGEKMKYLSVKVNISDSLKWDIKNYIRELFMRDGTHYQLRTDIFEEVFEDCFSKKCEYFCFDKKEIQIIQDLIKITVT